jgi:SAM-dependent methyltransferase
LEEVLVGTGGVLFGARDVMGLPGASPALRRLGRVEPAADGRLTERVAGGPPREIVAGPGGRAYVIGADAGPVLPPPAGVGGTPTDRHHRRLRFHDDGTLPFSNDWKWRKDVVRAFDDAGTLDETNRLLRRLKLKGTVVDVGCGRGGYLKQLRKTFDRYVGVDPDRDGLKIAAERARRLGIKAKFVKGTAQKVPLPDKCAHVVMTTYALAEVGSPLRTNVKKALNEMRRLARDGATLVIADNSGSIKDGYYDVLNIAEAARGGVPWREMVDVWIEVFLFLNRHAVITYVATPKVLYEFEDLEDALWRCEAIVKDLGANTHVNTAVRRYFERRMRHTQRKPSIDSEGMFIVAKLKD